MEASGTVVFMMIYAFIFMFLTYLHLIFSQGFTFLIIQIMYLPLFHLIYLTPELYFPLGGVFYHHRILASFGYYPML